MKLTFTKSWTVILTLLALTFSAAGVTPAHAITLTVTNTADSGGGSLRDTIASAGVGDTITFAPALSGGTIHLASTLELSQDVTIDGSALASQITISGDTDNNGTSNVRVFYVNSGVTATLDSLIITKGTDINGGGGIYNDSGTLTVTNSTLSGNSSTSSSGGGIFNTGTLAVTNSTLSGNSAGFGGGIFNNGGTLTLTNSTLSGNSSGGGGSIYNTGTLTVTNSTLSGNSATSSGGGGGIFNTGTLAVTNSTLSGNSASSGGGGIFNITGALTVTNSTFSGNSATSSSGGGIFNNSGTMTVTNSTLSGNSATSSGGGGIRNYNGTLNYANTIIVNSSSGGECVNNATIGTNINNLVEDSSCSASLSGDPNLDALANNGGPTQTFALLIGSSAINAGNNTICAASPVNGLDQRGMTRPQGVYCDIGAFELELYTLFLPLILR